MSKRLLEVMSRFTYYDMENLEVGEDILKFNYISVIKDIVCTCELSENSIKIYIDNEEIADVIKSDDVLYDLGKIAEISNYTNKLKIDDYNISSVDGVNNIEYKMYKLELNTLKEVVAIVDRILLNCCLIASNKRKIKLDKVICIYPDAYDEMKSICTNYIIDHNYSQYSGSIYGINVRYHSSSYMLTLKNCVDYDCLLDIKDIKVVDFIQYNKNLYQALNILKRINLNCGSAIILDKYTMRVLNGDNTRSVIFYHNMWIDIEDNIIGKLVGSKCNLYDYISLDNVYLLIRK